MGVKLLQNNYNYYSENGIVSYVKFMCRICVSAFHIKIYFETNIDGLCIMMSFLEACTT